MTPHSTRPTDQPDDPLERPAQQAASSEEPEQAELAALFRGFAEHRAGRYAPFTAAVAFRVAESPVLLAVAAAARPGQSRPDLFLGALHRLVLDLADHSRHHPVATSYAGARHLGVDPASPPEASPSATSGRGCDGVGSVDHVVEFAHDHRDALQELVATHTVQTNEIGRASFLFPGLVAAARHAGSGPLALVEIGASAGLNLVLDRYRLAYRHEHDRAARHGAEPDAATVVESAVHPAALTVECQLRGPHRPPLAPAPSIRTRLGVDLHPLDPCHADDRQWLRALVWPDHGRRRDRLDDALGMAVDLAARGELPTVHQGHANHVATLIERVPVDEHPLIVNCAVAAHMTPDGRERFTDAVLAASRQRPLSWLQAEPRTDGDPRRLRLQRCHRGQVTADHALARYHPHGAHLTWASDHT